MTFFDEVGKRLNYAVSEVSSRTREFTSVTKLNTSISAREREIESAYAQIGKLLFEREAADPESPAAALCAKITANRESILQMKANIAKIREDSKEARQAKSDELFRNPEAPVNVDATEVPEEDCCCVSDADSSCCCSSDADSSSCCCGQKAADAAKTVADTASAAVDAAEAACDACDCVCDKAADTAEAVAEKAEDAAKDLSDFYKKPEDNA